jgi:membrane-bound lytic murein transglycosylase D
LYADLEKEIKTINLDQQIEYELPTELLKKRLKEMDSKSPFNIEYNQGLENIIKSFLKNRKKAYERLMALSEYYFPTFEAAFAKQNVPLEIKYLAVVESALNPKAVSRVGATGLWQFMYQTGKQYNLHIDSYVDERSDPLKAIGLLQFWTRQCSQSHPPIGRTTNLLEHPQIFTQRNTGLCTRFLGHHVPLRIP